MEIKTLDARELTKSQISIWERLWKESKNSTLFNSFFWVSSSQHLHKKIIVLFFYKKNKLLAILPLAQKRFFIFKTFISPGGRYLDKLCLLTKDTKPAFIKHLIKNLPKGNYILKEVEENYVAQIPGIKLFSSENPYISINDDPYVHMSNKNRNELINKVARLNPALKLQKITKISQNDLQIMFSIESSSPKVSNKRAIFDNQDAQLLFKKIAASYNNSALFFLIIEEKPVAYMFGIYNREKTKFMAYNMAYLKEHRQYTPGKILLYFLLQELKNEEVKIFDFSRGMTILKRQFTPFSVKQYNLYFTHSVSFRIFIYLKVIFELIIKRVGKLIKYFLKK